MGARYTLAALSLVFLALATWRISQEGGRITPASRTWLTIGIMFGLVGAYLWMSA